MAHTPGPATVRYANNLTAITFPSGEMQLSVHGVYDGLNPLRIDMNEWEANAEFIADAFTVTHETGKTPRMLQEENKHLLEALKEIVTHIVWGNGLYPDVSKANMAIAKAEGKEQL